MFYWALSSVGPERRPYKAEVKGSSPLAPTNSRGDLIILIKKILQIFLLND